MKVHKKHASLLKVLLLIIVGAGVVGIGMYLAVNRSSLDDPQRALPDLSFGWKFPVAKFPLTGPGGDQIAYSDIRDPGGVPQGLPVRLKIPIIGVDSAIEDALITSDGRMDVPAGSLNVAWFALGPQPGQAGSAVIGGHFGISDGVPFVFYNLDKLRIGDRIYIVDDKGDTLTFVVRSIKLFDRNADATTVFTSDDGLAHLNLITCEGIWNQVNGTYPERRVVFTDAVSGEYPVVQAVPIFLRPLSIGAQGLDVEALQTALLEKGLLKIPAGVAKGYFGNLTRAAVAAYQTSVGLPSVGIFGPLTRAKLISELGGNSGLPDMGPGSFAQTPVSTEKIGTSNSVKNSPSFPRVFILFIKNLYATPLDGLLTSLLLASIVFMTVRVIKQRKAQPTRSV